MPRPAFPGEKKAAESGTPMRGRAVAGNGDASRLRNQIQSFCDAHDGERGYEDACAKGRAFAAALGHMKSPSDRGNTPGRKAAAKAGMAA